MRTGPDGELTVQAGPPVAGVPPAWNRREILVQRGARPTRDQSVCATWTDQSRDLDQQGLAVRFRAGPDGRRRAVTLTKNTFANYVWIFNLLTWDTRRSEQPVAHARAVRPERRRLLGPAAAAVPVAGLPPGPGPPGRLQGLASRPRARARLGRRGPHPLHDGAAPLREARAAGLVRRPPPARRPRHLHRPARAQGREGLGCPHDRGQRPRSAPTTGHGPAAGGRPTAATPAGRWRTGPGVRRRPATPARPARCRSARSAAPEPASC